jgi:hypothetical protein
MIEKLKEKWHSFKIWFCKEELDFFQKQIERLERNNSSEMVDLREEVKSLKHCSAIELDKLAQLTKERQDLLFLDPEKIVTTEVIVVDEIGRPMQKKVLLIGGRQLSAEETKILQEEARFIKRTMWWDVVQNTVVNTAKLKMFEGAKDYGDMVGGKGILYAADIYRKILDRILE